MAAPREIVAALKTRHLFMQKQPRRGAKAPRQVPPNAVRLLYQQTLAKLQNEVEAVIRRMLFDNVEAYALSASRARPDAATRHDAVADDVAHAADAARAAIEDLLSPSRLRIASTGIANRVNAHNRAQVSRQTRAVLGIDVLSHEPWAPGAVAGFVRDNTRLIRSLGKRQVDRVEGVILSGIRSGRRAESMSKEIQDRFGIEGRAAALIARDQVNKLNGEINQLRQTSIGITDYTWRSVGDDKVRDLHEEYDGETFAWNAPPSDGHPGEAINCRCTAEPNFDGLLGIAEEP